MKKLLVSLLLILSCGSKHVTGVKASAVSKAVTTTRPNILILLLDDVGIENITSFGGQSYQTPNIDLIASEGTRYTMCHSTPLCSPSRFMLLTGKYNFRNYFAWGQMDTTNRTIANMLKDAGYSTAVFGKWQLGGGDASIHALGFQEYTVFNPYMLLEDTDELDGGNRGKNPSVFTHGAFLPDSVTLGKYGEDVWSDSLISFISRPRTNPFFVYYPMTLVHIPHEPTPDDADFAIFTPNGTSDTKYYPSMMKYMDKIIGKVYRAIDSLGLANNTVILIVGDNGTSAKITSLYKCDTVQGGKGKIIEYGSHVPLITHGLGTGVDTSLIDFTDFLPTIAHIAGISKPSTYGTLDGNDFLGTRKRKWIFCWFWPHRPFSKDSSRFAFWAQDYKYKRYGWAFPSYKINSLFNYSAHPMEKSGSVLPRPYNKYQNREDSILQTAIYNLNQQ